MENRLAINVSTTDLQVTIKGYPNFYNEVMFQIIEMGLI